MREWWHNGVAGRPTAVDDPLARMLAAHGFAPPAPDFFTRSSDGRAALGIWRIPGDVERRAEAERGSAAAAEAVRLHKEEGRDERHVEAAVAAAAVLDHKHGARAAGLDKKSRWATIAGSKLPTAGISAS